METQLFDLPLEVDTGALEERGGEELLIDDARQLMMRENRLGLFRGDTARVLLDTSIAAADMPLRCVAHAHPDCRFRWVRLTVDFQGTEHVIIRDMSPQEVMGDQPVKITTTYGGKLSFEIKQFKLGPEFKVDRAVEHQVYFPEIRSSGIDFPTAHWDFLSVADTDLHVDRDLRMLVEYPATLLELEAKFILRAHVAMKGLPGLIPLVGRQNVTIERFDHVV